MQEADLLPELREAPVPKDPSVEVDACGTFCPIPLVELGKAMRAAPSASLFLLLATDPGTGADLLTWARGWGHSVVAIRQSEGCSAAEHPDIPKQVCYWIRRGTR